MKNIKILQFFDKEYDGPKGRILTASLIGGISFALLLLIIHEAAKIAVKSHEKLTPALMYLGIYTLVFAVTIICKRYTLNKILAMSEEVVSKIRIRLANKLRRTELRFVEGEKKSRIYSVIIQDTQVISESYPHLANTLDACFSIFILIFYILFMSVTGFLLTVICIFLMYRIFFSYYGKVKKDLAKARLKETDFLDSLSDIISGFKEIKLNRKKSDDLFSDIKDLSFESEKLKKNAEIRYDNMVTVFFFLFSGFLGR